MHSFPSQTNGRGFMELEIQSAEMSSVDLLMPALYAIQGVRRVTQL
jgi:hypothetical protein